MIPVLLITVTIMQHIPGLTDTLETSKRDLHNKISNMCTDVQKWLGERGQTHPDVVVDVMQGFVSAALHFGQQGPSGHGWMAHDPSHVAAAAAAAAAAAQTTDYLGLAENALDG